MEARARGPGQPTLIERMILGLHLPYAAGASVFALLIPGARLLYYLLETMDLSRAVDAAFVQPDDVPLVQRLGILVLQVVVPLYTYGAIRYMRRTVERNEDEVSALLPDGRTAYRESFAGIPRSGPPILVGALILGPGLLLSPPPANIYEVVVFLPANAILFLAYGTAGWVYFAALGGLNRLLKKPLRLRPFYEDRMLGTRVLGTLCLSLAAAFFGLMALLTAQFPLAPVPDAPPLFLFNLAVIGLLVAGGVVAFLLPLRTVHEHLARTRRIEGERVRARVGKSLASFEGANRIGEPGLAEIRSLVAAELAERRIAEIPDWPVDTQILGRFAFAALTLVAAVLARIILYVLRF